MLKSMTAFGRAKLTVGGKDITAEIRSVNNRYFDCNTRLPRAYSYLEEKIKPYLQSRGISRGKVDVSISVEVVETEGIDIALDTAYARGYIEALRRLRDEFGLADDISVMSVARNQEIFSVHKPEEDAEAEWQNVLSVLSLAVDAFLAGRAAEGANIEKDLRAKVDNIGKITEKIETLSEQSIKGYHQRLRERLTQVLADNKVTADENRILTECAIFADRVAIDEELVRLRSHFTAFDGILKMDEPTGRKLDFLIQEMNREINTVGSKCSDSEIAHLVVDVKTELEKIREQIQNIE
ncbi:MAG: YicC family protein [Clostridia bacterium]|nr:YicC family protein [Clostridia bacterium]